MRANEKQGDVVIGGRGLVGVVEKGIGEGGLLQLLTKRVLESALGARASKSSSSPDQGDERHPIYARCDSRFHPWR
ncbi:hypothetical protein ACWC9U_38150 [Streptomyces sp. 900116325]